MTHFLLRLLAALLLLCAPLVQAASLPGSPVSPLAYAGEVDVALVASAMPLRQQLQVMKDESAQRDAEAAMQSDAWRTMSADGLIGGYSTSAIWLRGSLYNSSLSSATRWISVGSARLEQVDFFLFMPGGMQAVETQHSGTRVALARRPLASHVPLFALTLAPGERMDFAVRIASESALDVSLTLWEPSAFRQAEGREQTAQALLIGIPFLLALYALIKGVIWRDRGFLRLALWIVTSMGYIVSFQGYLYRYLLPGGGSMIVHAPSTFAGLSSIAFAWMILAFVPLHRLRGWIMIYRAWFALMLGVTLWTVLGDYHVAAPVSNLLLGSFYLCWIVSMAHAWWRGLPNARLFLLSFSLVWLAMCAKILELNGMLDQRWMPDWQLSWLFQLGLLPMMTLIVVDRSMHLYRRHVQMQQDLLASQVQEQLRLEQAVAERTQALRDALVAADDANHAKTDFLARISHDLRTPLTSILGFADMVQASRNDSAGHGRIIRRSARHMLNMVNDLIDYARGDNAEGLRLAPTYIHALVHTMAQEGAELARRRNNRFSWRIEGNLPPVLQLDAKGLHRVVGNLLDNAAKYTHDGSIDMLVQCGPGAIDDGPLQLSFRIKDNGSGIAPSYQQRIFEPFARAESARGQPGIGLGLAIVKQWVARMHGSVTLDSAPGLGTAITLRLPTETAAEENIARHHVLEGTDVLPVVDGGGRLVWVVEDSPEIAQLLADQLASLGFAVTLFGDGQAVITRMGMPGAPDLLLTDYQMPGADGDQVLHAARARLPGVPVVLLSATSRAPAALSLFDASLLKPINFLELQDTLGRLLSLDTIAIGTSDEPAPDDDALPLPPPASLRAVHGLIDLGAISDLIDWAEALRTGYPQYEAFYRRARQLIDQGNLSGLARLCRTPGT